MIPCKHKDILFLRRNNMALEYMSCYALSLFIRVLIEEMNDGNGRHGIIHVLLIIVNACKECYF